MKDKEKDLSEPGRSVLGNTLIIEELESIIEEFAGTMHK